MSTEQLEVVFWVVRAVAVVVGLALMACAVMRSWEEARRGPVNPEHWPAAPEERECQRDLWARFQAEWKLKRLRRLERCRSQLGERLEVNGAVRRIG